MEFSADDIVLSNIRDNGQGGVDFNMHVLTGNNGVLNQQVLLDAVEVNIARTQ